MNQHTALRNGPSISFEALTLKLGGNSILNAISFTVEPGSIHCIIGPNGGGKTSLIRSLLGQMPHTGTIRISWNSAEQTTGYVPQALDFDRTLPLTVGDFMAMTVQKRPVYFGMSGKKAKIIGHALSRVGMEEKVDYLFGGLSGGERQRVLLAQALIPEPSLLILDEPATGLDRKGYESMHSIMEEMRTKGTTIIMIHHDISEVRRISDMVTCINQKVLFSGTPEEMLTPETILSIYSSTKDN